MASLAAARELLKVDTAEANAATEPDRLKRARPHHVVKFRSRAPQQRAGFVKIYKQ